MDINNARQIALENAVRIGAQVTDVGDESVEEHGDAVLKVAEKLHDFLVKH